MFAQPLGGALSDRIGRKPVLYWFGIMGVLCTVPLMQAIGSAQNATTAFLLVLGALLIITGSTSVAAGTNAELFPAEGRPLGVGLPYAISVSLFGGTAEYVALWFKSAGMESGFFWYVTAAIGVSLFAYWRLPETRWQSEMAGKGAA